MSKTRKLNKRRKLTGKDKSETIERKSVRKTSGGEIVMPTVEEDRAITAAAKGDPDAQPLSAKQLKAMVPMRKLRGRPRLERPKRLVSVRYSPEVIAYFKSTGKGWQSRMDGVLREYVARQGRRSQRSSVERKSGESGR